MRWLLVAILGYGGLVIQTTLFQPGALAVLIDGHWARPDLLLMLGLFLALYLKPHEVFLAAWGLGLGADFISISGRLGIQAFLWAAALAALAHLRHNLDRTRVVTQVLLALAAVTALHLAWYLTARLVDGAPLAVGRSIEQAVLDGLYTALLAPYVFWVLARLRGPLGVTTQTPAG